jgi:uncharacterized protein (TIGR02231 family)
MEQEYPMGELSRQNCEDGNLIGEQDGNRIREVVVYGSQAYVKRQARIRAQQGLNQFLMEVKAFRVDVDSAQAAVFGDGEILSVQYRELPVKDAPQEDLRQLEEELEALNRQRKALKSKQDVQDKQARFLDSIIAFAETEIPTKIKTQFPEPENIKSMLAFLEDNYQQLVENSLSLKHQIEDLDKEIRPTSKKLVKLRRPKQAMQRVIEVLFESPTEQEVDIEAGYVAMNAAWIPVYKVDVPQDLSTVKLNMFARIQQTTGENWNTVKLVVSNAVPLSGAVLPTMESWYLELPTRSDDFAVAGADEEMMIAGIADEKKVTLRATMSEEMAAELEDELSEMRLGAEFRQADQIKLPLAFEYELPQAVSIDSGKEEILLPLFTKERSGEFYNYAVPGQDPLTYLVCRISADSALLGGRLNVHFGGRFVAGTTLTEKKAGEDLLVNLGAERSVKVQREKVTDKLTETFFGKVDRSSVARELEYRIQVENLKDETARIHMFDSIPVSKTDRIQIKGVEIKPQPTLKDYQDREGVMLWDIQVKPGAVQEIRIKFFVKHPKESPPLGL